MINGGLVKNPAAAGRNTTRSSACGGDRNTKTNGVDRYNSTQLRCTEAYDIILYFNVYNVIKQSENTCH